MQVELYNGTFLLGTFPVITDEDVRDVIATSPIVVTSYIVLLAPVTFTR